MNTPASESSLCNDCSSDIFWKCPWVMSGEKPNYAKFESTPIDTTQIYQFDTVERCRECEKFVKEVTPKRADEARFMDNPSKPVAAIDINTGEVIYKFTSIKEAGGTLKMKPSNITRCLVGKRETAGGFEWQYITKRKKAATN